MRDADLRKLERASLESAGPAGSLRYAEALARSGRAGDALAVLIPNRHDPGVRAEIARLSRFAAVEARPVEGEPRVLFCAKGRALQQASLAPYDELDALFVTPLGVVVSSHAVKLDNDRSMYQDEHAITLRDLDTGEVRARVPDEVALGVAGDVVVARDPRPYFAEEPSGFRLSGYDLWTGERLWRVELERTEGGRELHEASCLVAETEIFVTRKTREAHATATRHDFADSRKPPATHGSPLAGIENPSGIAVAGDVLLVHDRRAWIALSRRSGAEIWRDPAGRSWGATIDARGWIVQQEKGLACFETSGRLAWLLPDPARPVSRDAWLGEELVVAGRGATTVAIERASGRDRQLLATAPINAAIAKDVVYVVPDGVTVPSLIAQRADGVELWQLFFSGELPILDRRSTLVPFGSRLYGATREGANVFCISGAT